jgi:Mg/Co/Ni transporter MgtE
MEKIVEHMLANMSDEEKQSMIKNIMPRVMEHINFSEMMPEIMENCMNNMKPEDKTKVMQDVMPMMMDSCLSSMTKQEREKMFTFYHSMLKEMEEKFL